MKKKIYIFFTILLGILLSIIVHGLAESWYINFSLERGIYLEPVGFLGRVCYLPFYMSALLLLAGLVGGYFLGKNWWRIVYVEKRHWRMRR
jgi:hypothetical protein